MTNVDANVLCFIEDVFGCDETNVVPERSQTVDQAWGIYKQLAGPLGDLRRADALPHSSQSASKFIIETLDQFQMGGVIKEFLTCYNFPHPTASTFEVSFFPVVENDHPMFMLDMTRVVEVEDIGDGDGFAIWAHIKDLASVPTDIIAIMQNYYKYLDKGKSTHASAEQNKLKRAGYNALPLKNKLLRKYRIRLRGIDAPEMDQAYGNEAKDELVSIIAGKTLMIKVYYQDIYERCIADVYCNDVLVQKTLLERGAAWHYPLYDNRKELKQLHEDAQRKKVGLWAKPHVAPWLFKHPQENVGSRREKI